MTITITIVFISRPRLGDPYVHARGVVVQLCQVEVLVVVAAAAEQILRVYPY